MCECGASHCGESLSFMGVDFKRGCGAPSGRSRTLSEVPAFLSRQPPRSEGESLLQRIFARGTGPQHSQKARA